MREIKFRAWNPNPGFMTAGVTLADIYNGFSGLNGKDVMQYTGLKDKNGKEIYEGDIIEYQSTVKYFDGRVLNTYFLTEVCFDLGGFCEKIIRYDVERVDDEFYQKWLLELKNERMRGYIAMAIYDDSGSIKKPVIGNLYENPELLSNEGQGDLFDK